MYEYKINMLLEKTIEFFKGDSKRIQHLMKVHYFSKLICNMENIDEHTKYITECSSIVHDIGIKPAEKKYGKCDGKLQEQEGPEIAKYILENLEFEKNDIERICYIVGHHHTYKNIDGLDYQILVEADFLVNFYEEQISQNSIKTVLDKIFKTNSAKSLCNIIYLNN